MKKSSLLFKFYYLYSSIMGFASRFLPFPKVKVIESYSSENELVKILLEENVSKVAIISDKGITSVGLYDKYIKSLEENKIEYIIHDDILPNPSFDVIENGLKDLRAFNCDAILAVGGGSVMDAAKIINACLFKKKDPRKLMGLFKILIRRGLLICVPTTAGTGSEVTIASVVSDPQKNMKLTSIDPALLPNYALLDATLMAKLPAHIVAATGIDALTHAVEAYVSRGRSPSTMDKSLEAINLIFKNLELAYKEPENLEAKEKMLKASLLAGEAFTRAYVGWVHAIAHQLGGLYHTPHGLANAVILPKILRFYLGSIDKDLAVMGKASGLSIDGKTTSKVAEEFVEAVENLSKRIDIPEKLPDFDKSDLELVAQRAINETLTTPYPVPKYFEDNKDLEDFILTRLV